MKYGKKVPEKVLQTFDKWPTLWPWHHWRRVRRTWFNLTFTRWLWSITSKVLNIETKSLKLFNFRFKQPSLSLFCCLVLLVWISFTRIITHLILFLACQVDDPNLDNVMADYQKQGISSSTHSELTDQKISRSEPQLYVPCAMKTTLTFLATTIK